MGNFLINYVKTANSDNRYVWSISTDVPNLGCYVPSMSEREEPELTLEELVLNTSTPNIILQYYDTSNSANVIANGLVFKSMRPGNVYDVPYISCYINTFSRSENSDGFMAIQYVGTDGYYHSKVKEFTPTNNTLHITDLANALTINMPLVEAPTDSTYDITLAGEGVTYNGNALPQVISVNEDTIIDLDAEPVRIHAPTWGIGNPQLSTNTTHVSISTSNEYTEVPPGDYGLGIENQKIDVNIVLDTPEESPYTDLVYNKEVYITSDIAGSHTPINDNNASVSEYFSTGSPNRSITIHFPSQIGPVLIGSNIESAKMYSLRGGAPVNIAVSENQILGQFIPTIMDRVTVDGMPSITTIINNEQSNASLKINNTLLAPNENMTVDGDIFITATNSPITLYLSENNGELLVNGHPVKTPVDLQITNDTSISANYDICNLTIDYGDNSYTLQVPQGTVTLTAPQRDGWIFDTWSSDDVGINGAKSVKMTIDTTGHENVTLVTHYQKYCTKDKPNIWN